MRKQVIRLTEGDLHRIINESVKKILREYNDGEPALVSNKILRYYAAKEMAAEYNMPVRKVAAMWFENVLHPDEFHEGVIPETAQVCSNIRSLGAKMYYDEENKYLFLAKNTPSGMGFFENFFNRSVKNILKETDCAGVMQTGCGDAPKGTNPEAGQPTVAFGPDKETSDRHGGFSIDGKAKWNKNPGNVQRREMYNPKSGKKR
jgi:hypothetical protein